MDTHLPAEARAGHPPAAPAPQAATAYFDMFGTIHVFDARLAARTPAGLPGADWTDFASRAIGRLRRGFGGAAVVAILAGALWGGAAEAQTRLLNVSYDPTRELYREVNEAFAAQLGRRRQRAGRDRDLARRLRQPGAGGDRRPRRPGGDARARLRHQRHRREDRQDPGGLAVEAAAQLLALHLDDRVPGARGQPQGHRRLGRPGRRRRAGHHAEPQDLGRRALELPRGLGLGREERPGPGGLRRQALRQRAGARHRGARLDHDLRPARHRRRAARLGERGVSRAQGARRGPVRHRHPLGLDARRAAGGDRRGQLATDEQRKAADAYLDVPLHARGPGARVQALLPRLGRQRGRSGGRRALPRARAGLDRRTSAAGSKAQPEHFGDGGVFDQIYVGQ